MSQFIPKVIVACKFTKRQVLVNHNRRGVISQDSSQRYLTALQLAVVTTKQLPSLVGPISPNSL